MSNPTNAQCLNCRSSALFSFIDLGDQPNANFFPERGDLGKELFFPFSMAVCQNCWQVQLEEFPSQEFLFANHPYITGINKPIVSHFEKLSAHIVKKLQLEQNSLVIDIGCNDGTLLSFFSGLGMRVLGVDPSDRPGKLCKERGINICHTFWNKASAIAIKQLELRPDLITATAVFYHIPDIHEFIVGLCEVMTEKTVFITQCIYLKDVIEKNQFDHFYHEHTMIHSLSPLKSLLEQYGMKIIDIEFNDVHGGSFILYVGLNHSIHPTSAHVEEAIAEEKKANLNQIKTFTDFTKRVQNNRDELLTLLRSLKAQGKTVYGLCASAKGNTLLNYAKIGPDLVPLVSEVNPLKIDKFTPGTHIPVVDERTIKRPPDYYLVLSWNFLDFFVTKYDSFLKSGGRFIVPNPDVRIL